jgi:endonuclease G
MTKCLLEYSLIQKTMLSAIAAFMLLNECQAKYTNGWFANMRPDSIPTVHRKRIVHLEEPLVSASEKVIRHHAFSLLYDTSFKISKWVAYSLSADKISGPHSRKNNFSPDPQLINYTKNDEDYKGSGYHRGHLAPAADMKWSDVAMNESFYYSNMTPQVPEFNTGIWSRLESIVREWANAEEMIYIVSGPILTPALKRIGKNQISVPDHFYKAVIKYDPPSVKGIGFLIPNKGSKGDLQKYTVTIDSLEKLTGIDFFHSLPDNDERKIEGQFCNECWFTAELKKHSPAANNPYDRGASVQCSGVTNSGSRCRIKTKNSNGLCHLHQNQN